MFPVAPMAYWRGEGLADAACCTVGLYLMRKQLLHVRGCPQHFGIGQFDRTVMTMTGGRAVRPFGSPAAMRSDVLTAGMAVL